MRASTLGRIFCYSTLWLLILALPAISRETKDPAEIPPEALLELQRGKSSRAAESLETLKWMIARGTYSGEQLALANVEIGALFMEAGLDSPAAASFSNASVLDEKNPRWVHISGTLAAAAGQHAQAIEAFEKALIMSSSSLPTHLQLARTLLQLDRSTDAREHFQAAIDLDSKIAFSHFGLGQIALNESAWAEAALQLEEALLLQPTALSLHLALSEIYRQLGEPAMASSHLQSAGDGTIEYLDPILTAVMSLDPEASILAKAASEKKAEELEQTIVKLGDDVSEQPEVPVLRRTLAMAKIGAGDVEGAIAELEKALEIDPKDVQALLQLAQALATEGSDVRSQDAYRRAAELAPHRRDVNLGLARSLAKSGEHEKAVPYFERAIESMPGDLKTRVQLARALAQSEQDQRAIEVLTQVLDDDPNWTRAHMDLGTILARRGDLDAAEQHLQRALHLDLKTTDYILTLFQLGSIRQLQGDMQGAISYYRRAVGLGPNMRDAHFNLGIALAQSGNLKEASEHFQRLTELDPQDKNARRLLARSQAGSGLLDEAIGTLKEAVETFPEDEVLRQELARMEQQVQR